jgi:hypothetical protein
MTKDEADILLLADTGKETASGTYLFRQAEPEGGNAAQKYILSVVYKGAATHHNVATTAAGTLSINGAVTECKTLADLAVHLGQKQKALKWPVPLLVGVSAAGAAAESPASTPAPAIPAETEAAPAPAETEAPKTSKEERAALFNEMDADSNGKIDINEAVAYGMDKKTFQTLDVNGDGKLSKKEISKWLKAHLENKSTAALSEPAFKFLHCDSSKDAANTALLADDGTNTVGKFLFRQSESSGGNETGKYILSVMFKGQPTHHNITTSESGALTINGALASDCFTLPQLATYLGKKQKAVKWPVPLLVGVPAE